VASFPIPFAARPLVPPEPENRPPEPPSA
jgi:hypothetical protein